MPKEQKLKLDEVGYWSEIKLDIIRDYAQAYSRILSAQASLHHVYIDGFAGAGKHISKQSGEFILGSPMNAPLVKPPFREFHFIDLNGVRAAELRKLADNNEDVHVYQGDCNQILEATVFPRCRYQDYRRALCLLDPYGLHLNWSILGAAGAMKTIEIFLNFPVMDMNMNVLWQHPENVQANQACRMDAFWGDDSWRQVAYRTDLNLFGYMEKTGNDDIVNAFRARLKSVAGFQFVPEPIPMRNTKGATVYYLFFASPNQTGAKIVGDIFNKYRNRGSY